MLPKDGDDDEIIPITKDGDDDEIIPITIVAPSPPRVYDLCRSNPAVDTDALAACALPLSAGEAAHGEIVNGRAADYDIFTFLLAEQGTVRVEARSDFAVIGALYDLHGHRFASTEGGDAADRFDLVRTLAPGRYFVRIEGRDSAQGSYTLNLETLPW